MLIETLEQYIRLNIYNIIKHEHYSTKIDLILNRKLFKFNFVIIITKIILLNPRCSDNVILT